MCPEGLSSGSSRISSGVASRPERIALPWRLFLCDDFAGVGSCPSGCSASCACAEPRVTDPANIRAANQAAFRNGLSLPPSFCLATLVPLIGSARIVLSVGTLPHLHLQWSP